MTTAADARHLVANRRERALVVICAAASIGLGLFAALSSTAWVATASLMGLLIVLAFFLPESWSGVVLAALISLQVYFPLPDSSFTLRAATVFLFAAALRALLDSRVRRTPATWMLPAFIFIIVALIGAVGAQNRYLALKGIYDWLPVLVSILVVGQLARTEMDAKRICLALVVGGVAEAGLGLGQYILGLDTVLDILRLPVSDLFYQPNLLRDRLVDLSFNWVIFDRAAPFGTFINGIDFSIYLAATLCLLLGIVLTQNLQSMRMSPRQMLAISGSALLMGGALLLTFKGSGFIALVGGIATIIVLAMLRTGSRALGILIVLLAGALVLALPVADLLMQRVTFLIQREQGGLGTAGRLEIWAALLQYLPARLLFGYGLNNATLIAEPARTLSGGAIAFISTTPESAYVAALIETGIAGFVSLFVLFAGTLVHGYRAIIRNGRSTVLVGVLAAVVALLLGNLTVAGFTTDQNGMLLGSLMGMVWGEWNRQ